MSYKIVKKPSTSRRLKALVRSAVKRDIHVDLNIEYYRKLIEVGCIYCGVDLKNENGYCIDRGDNKHGYVVGNVFPCCPTCNRAKGSMEHLDFLAWADRFYHFQRTVADSFKVKTSTNEVIKSQNRLKNKSFYKNSEHIKVEGSRE